VSNAVVSAADSTVMAGDLKKRHAVALRPAFCFGSTDVAAIVAITQSSAGARGPRASTTTL
jgi:hypothetical protein